MPESLFDKPAMRCFFQIETLKKLVSCEFCETFKNVVLTDQLLASPSIFMEHICNIKKSNFN